MAGPYLQVALEEAPNCEDGSEAVSSDVFYPPVKSITDDDGFVALEEQELIRGFLAPMPHLGAAEYAPAMKLSAMHLRPASLGVFLAAVMGSIDTDAGVAGPTVVDPDTVNIPVGAHRHVFSFIDADPPQSLQLTAATGDGKYRKAQGMGVESLDFKFADGALETDASLIGLVLKSISDPSITPVVDAQPPFRQGDMTLTWLSSSARTKAFEFGFKSQIEALSEPTVASLFPSLLLYKNDALPTIAGTIEKASMEDADTAAIENGTQFAVLIKIVGRETIKRAAVNISSSSVAAATVVTCAAPHNLPAGDSTVVIAGSTGSTPTINGTHVATKIDATTFSIPVNCSVGAGAAGTVISDTAYYPTLWIELPGCQLVKVDRDDIEAKRRREGKYEWEARYDAVTAKLATATLVNAQAAYGTYA
jgi:hypothetical protein